MLCVKFNYLLLTQRDGNKEMAKRVRNEIWKNGKEEEEAWNEPFLIWDALSVISFTVGKWISPFQWEKHRNFHRQRQRQWQRQQHTKSREIPITLHIARMTLETLTITRNQMTGWGCVCAIHTILMELYAHCSLAPSLVWISFLFPLFLRLSHRIWTNNWKICTAFGATNKWR